MDTDDLTEEAYSLMLAANKFNRDIVLDMGVAAGRCKTEDEWLDIFKEHLDEIIEYPRDYLDECGIDWDEAMVKAFSRKVVELKGRVLAVQGVPFVERTQMEW